MGSRAQVLAIAGGSGSGKTTLAGALLEVLTPDRAALVPLDNYYHDLSHLSLKDRDSINFDLPEALVLALFSRHLGCLRRGEPVECRDYDFTAHCIRSATSRVEPRPVNVVEGILLAATPALRNLYDHLVFIETPEPSGATGVIGGINLRGAVMRPPSSVFGSGPRSAVPSGDRLHGIRRFR